MPPTPPDRRAEGTGPGLVVHFPVPPEEADSVTLHAADFGTFEVPVE
ncbi:hypothetical protein ABZ234_13385 [Nocardiopsis sp. NPDC006198]